MDCVMNFVALGVISEIDDIYASSVKNFVLKDCIKNPPTITRNSASFKGEGKGRSNSGKVVRVLFKLLRVIYCSYYYYFMAFTIFPYSV